MISIRELFDLEHTIAASLFDGLTYPWEALSLLEPYILKLGPTLNGEAFIKQGEDIWIAKDAVVAPTASLHGPLIIDRGAEIRHSAFIRGSVIVGKGAVVGNSTELKNALLFDKVQVPHYNYVGDSILGYAAHFGAGVITSNVKGDKSLVVIRDGEQRYPTNRKKVGAFVGDFAELGCNTVLNPGTILGRRSQVYPLSSLRGCLKADMIWKGEGRVMPRQEKDR